jgi:hypothetical protein
MKDKLIVALIVAALLSFGFSRNHSEAANETVTSYEYQVLIEGGLSPNVKQLNDAGAQGWELVSVTRSENGPSILYLKRVRKSG